MPLVSLIIPTLGREVELFNLLNSIRRYGQSFFEVIIIDQNPKKFLENLRNNFSEFNFINVEFKGVSRARNFGLTIINGDYVFFPDDDSELLPKTFENLEEIINKYNPDLISGRTIDRNGVDSVIKYYFKSCYFNFKSCQGKFVESTIVIKTDIIKKYLFDEKLGVGEFYGAEEALDLIYRLKQYKMYYSRDFKIYHPPKISFQKSFSEIKRVYTYRCGFSAFHFKHKMYSPVLKRIVLIFLALPYIIINPKYSLRYYFAELLGLFTGLIVNDRKIWEKK